MPKFIPNWEIRYLYSDYHKQYCVIKNPEEKRDIIVDEKTKEETEIKRIVIQEGVTVLADGRWYYWRKQKPWDYDAWKDLEGWNDSRYNEPDVIVKAKLNKDVLVPRFKPRNDNNWAGLNRVEVPNHLTNEMLDNLALAHLMVSDELHEGKPQPTNG